MSLTERNRAVLYQKLTVLIDDEEAVGEMISNIATRDDLATKDFVRAEIHVAINRLVVWMIGVNLVQLGVILGFLR